ncbi:MAG: hypothetical protein DRO00_09760 [Thermoproteota archaeon]|nr:MAG: hypothetical protein DRO00_09760 [Candidatus Korarchaeota archaeon]
MNLQTLLFGPEEVFFLDPAGTEPIGEANSSTIEYNLSAMPDLAEAWIDLISHEWLHWTAKKRCGVEIDDYVVITILEMAGLSWDGGGCP